MPRRAVIPLIKDIYRTENVSDTNPLISSLSYFNSATMLAYKNSVSGILSIIYRVCRTPVSAKGFTRG